MRRDSKGIALVTALAILTVVALLVLGTVFSTQIESWTTRNDTTSTQAYYIAHAGLEKYKTIAFQSFRFYLENLQKYGSELSTSATCGNLLSVGLDLNRDYVLDGTNDLLPGGSRTVNYAGGKYTIKFAASGPNIVLTSVGQIHGARATVQMVFEPKNAGLFSNAIFAGSGASSKFINGGATIWGSVYIQGDTSISPPPYVIDSNGNFSMHNYYDQSDLLGLLGNRFTASDLTDMIGSTATDQKDLCARLRVAYGQVATGGSSDLGDASAPSGYKGSLAGINVYQGASDISVSGASSLVADNYPNGKLAYDLSQPMKLPTLGGSSPTPCKSDATKTWAQCLADASTKFNPTAVPAGAPASCNLATITSGSTLTFGSTDIDCSWTDAAGVDHGFKYTYDSNNKQGTLTVHGLIDFSGYDVHFAQNVATKFSGKSTIMATADASGQGGNIIVDGDVLPTTNFPKDDVLGLLASNDLTFTGANENQLSTGTQTAVGLFYAGNQASIDKGAVVMGSVLANYISTSSGNAGQTAKVVQVPGLEYNLSPGFTDIPNDMLATFRIVSYERL